MSNTVKPTLYFAVEYKSTRGNRWLLAAVANQGAARGRAEKLGTFVGHVKQVPITEEEYNRGQALLEAQGKQPDKIYSTQKRTAHR